MNKTLRDFLKWTGIAALAVIIGCTVLWNLLFPPPISITKMEKIFQKDYDTLSSVVDYFQGSEYASIFINNEFESGVMFVCDLSPNLSRKYVQIKDPEIIRKIDILIKWKGYRPISRDGNTILFNRWSDLGGSRGIAYTIDGAAPEMQYLIEYKQLSEEHWYYYEENYHEYKRRIGES